MFSGIAGMEKGIDKAYENVSSAERQKQGRRSGTRNSADNGNKFVGTQLPSCIGFSEIDRNAIAIYRYHYPEHRNYGDATRIVPDELPDFDLLVGGFPCQAFSIAGKRGGFEDTRGTLFFEIARILRAKRPRHFLLENVKGLYSHDDGRTFKTIVNTLIDIGYCVEWDCLNSKFYGVPQNRERVFIVGHLGRLPGREVFPIGDSHETAIQARPIGVVSGTLSTKNQSGQCNFDGSTTLILGKDGQRKNKAVASTLTGGGHSGGNHSDMDLIITKTVRSGGVSSPHGHKSNWDSYEIDGRIRRLTPRECEALQGFPRDWTRYGIDEKGNKITMSDSARYKALGNAVTVNVIEAIISKMMVCCD